MLFFSAFDPSQPLIPVAAKTNKSCTHQTLSLDFPGAWGIRMQCLALILTTINSLLLMFLIIKDDSF